MATKLPINAPFQNREERILVSFVLLLLVALPFILSYSSFRREILIAGILQSESNSDFLRQEIYHKTSDIDVLLIGPCRVWWQLYTPLIKSELERQRKAPANVITLGFNHFGSDLIYLILKDTLQRRKVKNLILSVPKKEDLHAFPHPNAIHWWVYPRDLQAIGRLSVLGHLKLLGLSVFLQYKEVLLSLARNERYQTALPPIMALTINHKTKS